MRQIQKSSMSFRVTEDLKCLLIRFSEANDLHSSAVIRDALKAYLCRNDDHSNSRTVNPAQRKG